MRNPLLTKAGSDYVKRGGSLINMGNYVRVSDRFIDMPTFRDTALGFRLFRTREKS